MKWSKVLEENRDKLEKEMLKNYKDFIDRSDLNHQVFINKDGEISTGRSHGSTLASHDMRDGNEIEVECIYARSGDDAWELYDPTLDEFREELTEEEWNNLISMVEKEGSDMWGDDWFNEDGNLDLSSFDFIYYLKENELYLDILELATKKHTQHYIDEYAGNIGLVLDDKIQFYLENE